MPDDLYTPDHLSDRSNHIKSLLTGFLEEIIGAKAYLEPSNDEVMAAGLQEEKERQWAKLCQNYALTFDKLPEELKEIWISIRIELFGREMLTDKERDYI
jgi:hypothetical protein